MICPRRSFDQTFGGWHLTWDNPNRTRTANIAKSIGKKLALPQGHIRQLRHLQDKWMENSAQRRQCLRRGHGRPVLSMHPWQLRPVKDKGLNRRDRLGVHDIGVAAQLGYASRSAQNTQRVVCFHGNAHHLETLVDGLAKAVVFMGGNKVDDSQVSAGLGNRDGILNHKGPRDGINTRGKPRRYHCDTHENPCFYMPDIAFDITTAPVS